MTTEAPARHVGGPVLRPGGPSEALARYRAELNFARTLRQPTPLSLGLLAALVAIHLGAVGLDLTMQASGVETGPAIFHGAKVNALVWQGQWWRLMSATFLHGGWLHLAFNAYAVFFLAPILERLYGARRLLLIYVVSGLCASAASLMFNEGVSVGASGAIFGMLGAMTVFGFKFRDLLPTRLQRAFGVQLLPWVAINLFVGFFFESLRIDNAAHVGGLIAGVVVALPMSTALEGRVWGWRRAALEVSFALLFVAIAWGLVSMLHQVMLCGGGAGRFLACYPKELLGL